MLGVFSRRCPMIESNLKHRELTGKIIEIFYEVYNELGFGFLEIVYKRAMVVALRQAGLVAVWEERVPVSFRGILIGVFRTDILVNNLVMLELYTSAATD